MRGTTCSHCNYDSYASSDRRRTINQSVWFYFILYEPPSLVDLVTQPTYGRTLPPTQASAYLDNGHFLVGMGGGAHINGYCIGGPCPESLWSKHINYLELLAIFWACQRFQSSLRGKVIQVFSDNMTVVYYLNKQGGTVSRTLCRSAMNLWDFCIALNITPVATHLPGSENTIADAVSRGALSLHELCVTMTLLLSVFGMWGTPEIDVFVSAKNKKCHLFCSRGGSNLRFLGDGLLLDWTGRLLYMFPPIPLIPWVLRKYQSEKPKCFLITPWQLCRVWFPTLLLLSRRRYLFVRETPPPLDLLGSYPMRLKLTAWLLDWRFPIESVRFC